MPDPNVPQPIRIDPKVLKDSQENPKPEEGGFIPSKIQQGEDTESYDARIRQERKDWEVRHSREPGETEEHFKKRLAEQKEIDRKPNESTEDYNRRIADYTQKKIAENIQKGIDSTKQGQNLNTTTKTAISPADVRYRKDKAGAYVVDEDGQYQKNANGTYGLV